VLFAADGYLVRRIHRLSQATALLEASVASEVSRIRQLTVSANDVHHDGIEALQADLVAAQDETAAAAGSARAQAQRYAERLARRVARTRRKQNAEVEGEIDKIRTANAQTTDAARSLENQLHEVESAEAAVRAGNQASGEKAQAVSQDLQAMNRAAVSRREQIAALRRSNERDVFAFELTKIGESKEIAGVRLVLLQADSKHNRYSVEIIAGERSLEAKDKSPNEPVRLYASDGKNPLELVVKEIDKDAVRGVLMISKSAELALSYSNASAATEEFSTR
jgi:chromosome segregation ATPase